MSERKQTFTVGGPRDRGNGAIIGDRIQWWWPLCVFLFVVICVGATVARIAPDDEKAETSAVSNQCEWTVAEDWKVECTDSKCLLCARRGSVVECRKFDGWDCAK